MAKVKGRIRKVDKPRMEGGADEVMRMEEVVGQP